MLWVISQIVIREVSVRAQAPLSEYSDKAASVTVLAGYVKWPTATKSPVTVGILGVDPFKGALEAMATKRSDRVEDLKDCQIIFVARSEHQRIDAILESLGEAHILTIGESEDFAKRGGMIGFVIEDGRVRFEVNTAAARRAGLGIDLRLLKLAVRVHNL